MTKTINHQTYGEIVYSESEWTGKKSLKINGIEATKISKKCFSVNNMTVTVNGSYFFGARLVIGDEVIELVPKSKWYEVVLACIPILFILMWGNIRFLCEIFPVAGGAIGGLIGGVDFAFSMLAMKREQKPFKKVLIGVVSIALTILVAYLVALLIINSFSDSDWQLR